MAQAALNRQVVVDVVVSDSAVRESTRILLDVHDHAGRDFVSGKDYILAGNPHPDCLVTDGVLIDMTGLELLEHLRISGDNTPAVMMTTRIDTDLTTRAERLSFKLLEKPPLTDGLIGTIRDACEHDGYDHRDAESAPRFPAAFEAADGQTPSWIDNAGTGVAIFDAEHRELNEKVLDYYDAILAGEPRESLDQLFARLVVHAAEHFVHEENYMRFASYPDMAGHVAAHQALAKALGEVPAITRNVGQDRSTCALEVLRFLKRWLMDHILGDDRALGAYLNSRGIH